MIEVDVHSDDSDFTTPKTDSGSKRKRANVSPAVKSKAVAATSKGKGKGKNKSGGVIAGPHDGGAMDIDADAIVVANGEAVDVDAEAEAEDDGIDRSLLPPGVDGYCCDLAKSSRSTCRKCDSRIDKVG